MTGSKYEMPLNYAVKKTRFLFKTFFLIEHEIFGIRELANKMGIFIN